MLGLKVCTVIWDLARTFSINHSVYFVLSVQEYYFYHLCKSLLTFSIYLKCVCVHSSSHAYFSSFRICADEGRSVLFIFEILSSSSILT